VWATQCYKLTMTGMDYSTHQGDDLGMMPMAARAHPTLVIFLMIRGRRSWYSLYITDILVGGFKHFIFSPVYGIILPIDFHIFQRGRSTTNQHNFVFSRFFQCDFKRSEGTSGTHASHVNGSSSDFPWRRERINNLLE
jgi:hypothetical protein